MLSTNRLRHSGAGIAPSRGTLGALNMTHNSVSQATDRYNELLAFMEGDHDLLRELIEVFLEDAPHQIDSVRRALAVRDADALYNAAHALKGSAGNFGAPDVVNRALRIEAYARQGNLDAAANEFESLETEMTVLVDELVTVREVS